jgi:Lrp/AsnC family transcriptional regulator for asnA, asnC and gidA
MTKILDRLDSQILQIITKNARIPFKDIADVCNVSRAAIHQRVQRLFEEGVLIGSGYKVDPKVLGYQVCTYVGVKLEKASRYKEVMPELSKIPEVVECHFTTGPYTLLLKLYARDMQHLMQLLNGRVQEITGVSETETLMSLDESINRGIPME